MFVVLAKAVVLALFVACAAAGLVVLVSGATTETRVFGALGLFFAVVAAVATAGELFTRPDAQAVRMTTVNADPAFVFPTSRGKLGMLLVLVGVGVALGVVAAISIAETEFWLCVGAFAVALAFGARRVLWPPSLVLTPTGVTMGPRHSAWASRKRSSRSRALRRTWPSISASTRSRKPTAPG